MLAIINDDERLSVMVPLGATIQVTTEPLDEDRLIDVEWEKKALRMFTSDIRDRCELIEDAGIALMDETTVIRLVNEGFGGEMVDVGAPSAYDAFSNGLKLFDIVPGAPGLHAFMKQHATEFENDFRLAPDGSFRSMIAYNRTIYFLSRKARHFHRNDTWR